VRTLKRTITSMSRRTIHVRLSKSLIAALKKRGLRSVVVTARVKASYADHRAKVVTRRLRVRR
jgi:hypothetical protein